MKISLLIELATRIADHLGIEVIPIEFAKIPNEMSRLVLKPKAKIVISDLYEDDYEQAAWCLGHEMRHAFQLYWVQLMNDNLAQVWREELLAAKNGENTDISTEDGFSEYSMQAIEIDADAFAIYYLRTYEGIVVKKPQELIQKIIEAYIVKYKDRL